MRSAIPSPASAMAGLIAGATILAVVFPIIWIVLTSFKAPRDVYALSLAFTPTLENFRTVFEHPWNLGDKLLNSLVVSIATVVAAIPIATMAAYGFSRFEFPGKRVLFIMIIATQFVPAAIVVLPYYLMFREFGLLDSYAGLILVNLSIVLPYAVWMIKGFIDAVPIDMEESAVIDGASRLRALREIVVPAAMPGLITAALFCFTLTWNEFLFALILTKQKALTLPVGLIGFHTERGDLWELMAAAGVMITLPMFLLSFVFQKHFIRSLTSGAVR
jgi:multiple sugar transport system permease protein